jgi:hypothetical protein
MFRSFDPKNQGPRDKAVARAEKKQRYEFLQILCDRRGKSDLGGIDPVATFPANQRGKTWLQAIRSK